MLRRGLLAGVSAAVVSRAATAQPWPPVNAYGGNKAYGPGGASGYGPIATGGPTLDLNFLATTLDPRVTFTRASAATYFDVTGTLQSATTNTPRIDYDPTTHVLSGLLIEESRTNLLLNSATLSTQSVTVTAAATTLTFYGTGSVALSGTFVGNLAGSGAFPARVSLTFTPTAGALTCTVTGSVLNAQVETGAFATSWISTAGTTATRAADVATMALSPPAAFAIASEIMVPVLPANPYAQGVATLDDGTNNNRVYLRLVNTAMQGVSVVSAATTASSSGAAAAINTTLKGAVVSNGPASALTVAYAGTAGAVQSGAQPTGLTTLRLGFTASGVGGYLNGYLRRVRYWPRALSSAELVQVTT